MVPKNPNESLVQAPAPSPLSRQPITTHPNLPKCRSPTHQINDLAHQRDPLDHRERNSKSWLQ
jgi:hypothetical protein